MMAEDPFVGATIERYQLGERLGAGGMGAVYRAHVHGPGGAAKEVALKILPPQLVIEDERVLMFVDEMRVAMALSHRNIVQTFDAGSARVGGGTVHFIAMELVDGCSLRELLRRLAGQPLPTELVLHLGSEICAALQYAHGFQLSKGADAAPGVVHRDISPANILLSFHGDVKLTDFGIAHAAGRLSETRDDSVKGKIAYMAPEQARGEAEARSDLFSLGAVLFETLTGRMLRPRADVLQIAGGLEQLPSLGALRADLPATLIALIDRCVASDLHARPQDAADVRKTLQDLLFELQLTRGSRSDPAALLGAALAATRPPALTPRDSKVDLVADALVQQALEVPSRSGTVAELPGAQPKGAAAPPIATGRSSAVTEPSRPRSVTARSSRAVLAALGVVLLGAGGAALWLTRGAAPPARPSAAADVAVRPLDAVVVVRPHPRDAAPPMDSRAPVDLAAPAPDYGRRPLDAVPSQKHSRGFGLADINAFPWAKVYVDGVYRGNTPLQRLRLTAGRHTLRLVNPGAELERRVVLRVRHGAHLKKVVYLEK